MPQPVDPEPFDRVVTEHGPTVLRVCRALLPADAAADAWSETFISALRAYPGLAPNSNIAGWLVTIAHNRAIDELRRRARRPTPWGDPSDLVEQSSAGRLGPNGAPDVDASDEHAVTELDDAVRSALLELSDRQRLAVAARHLADLPYREVAALLDSSEATARRAVADGIAHLRHALDRETT